MTTYEEKIESVVDAILQDYKGDRDIDRIEHLRQPDKDVVIDIIEKLRRIVFPGYFKDKNYRTYNAKHNLSMLIEDVPGEPAFQHHDGVERTGPAGRSVQPGAIFLSMKKPPSAHILREKGLLYDSLREADYALI